MGLFEQRERRSEKGFFADTGHGKGIAKGDGQLPPLGHGGILS